MLNILRAEHLKMRHTFGNTLPVIAPVFSLCFVLVVAFGTGNILPAFTWNIWYTTLLPGMAAIICYLGISKDKKIHYCNILSVPLPVIKLLAGKVFYCFAGLFISNIILCAGTFIFAMFAGTTINIYESLAAVVLLCITYLWEIPLYILLSLHFKMAGCLLSCMFLVFTDFIFASNKLWWIWPSSIPSRLMCPVLGIMPNGILAPASSPLLDNSVILPGIIISFAWFILLSVLLLIYFKGKVVKE